MNLAKGPVVMGFLARSTTPNSRFHYLGLNMQFVRLLRHAIPIAIACLLSAAIVAPARADDRPNVLWITIEDWSPDLSCYGTKGIHTPNVDQLAAQGIR